MAMELRYGNGGWVRVTDEEWPGPLFVRLAPDGRGRWRTTDFYLQGEWRHVVGGDLREMDLAGVEEVIQAEAERLSSRARVPGPDLRLLASSYAGSYGLGVYGGRHCDSCSAPLRGSSKRTVERWSSDWVALSWFAQYDDNKIPRPKSPPDQAERIETTGVPRLQRPTNGLTDEFLTHVRDAYRQALADGLRPAKELARQLGDGATPRTIHKWVSLARQRGIMPPARRGKAEA